MAMEGEFDTEDLIGCRIKVWWPKDKKFYGGTIKSYDPLKGKHVYSSEEREVDESTEALRENVNGEEESDSEGHQDNSNVGVSAGEIEKSHIEPSSPDDALLGVLL